MTKAELMVCPPTSRIPAVPSVDEGEVKPWCDGCCARSPVRPIAVQHPLQAAAGMSITDFDEMSTRILDRVRGGVR